MRTNYVKVNIVNLKWNSKCRLSGERDKMANHIVNECNKLAQKEYKTIHDWVGKVIHEELCKKLKFDNTTKWYMYKLKSVQENKTHKILRDFEIKKDHQISVRNLT